MPSALLAAAWMTSLLLGATSSALPVGLAVGLSLGGYLGSAGDFVARRWGRSILEIMPGLLGGVFVGALGGIVALVTLSAVSSTVLGLPVAVRVTFLALSMGISPLLGAMAIAEIQSRLDPRRLRPGVGIFASPGFQTSPPPLSIVGNTPAGAAPATRTTGPDLPAAAVALSRPTATRLMPESNRPEVPGYEVLRVLGQGGMGIVYLARQLAANRLVALKMIRGGDQHRDAFRQRFRLEALAEARLNHPHIVQIYEMGESEGRAYFALEYVDGGNLAQRCGGRPQPVHEAAALVEQLARAVHAAHVLGVLHRDLKPANVLLTKEGQPKITDFGLAKLEGEAAGLTHNQILGTPRYMSPEQAAGDAAAVGRATDVYSLGVILYELLTGRPVFRGVTVLELLDQLRSQPPLPPRRLRPQVPRDLEAVCLNCLEKKPQRRYFSAEALADDLARFLRGEPTRVRPAGVLNRVLAYRYQYGRKPHEHMSLPGLLVVLAFWLLLVTLKVLSSGGTHSFQIPPVGRIIQVLGILVPLTSISPLGVGFALEYLVEQGTGLTDWNELLPFSFG